MNLEDQFVVDLHNHTGLEVLLSEVFVDAKHRHFDEVCGTALDRGIDGISLGKIAKGCVP